MQTYKKETIGWRAGAASHACGRPVPDVTALTRLRPGQLPPLPGYAGHKSRPAGRAARPMAIILLARIYPAFSFRKRKRWLRRGPAEAITQGSLIALCPREAATLPAPADRRF